VRSAAVLRSDSPGVLAGVCANAGRRRVTGVTTAGRHRCTASADDPGMHKRRRRAPAPGLRIGSNQRWDASAASLLQSPHTSTGCRPAGRLARLPVHLQIPGRRRDTGPARHGKRPAGTTGHIQHLIRRGGAAEFGEQVARRRTPRQPEKWNRLTCALFNGERLIRSRIQRSFRSPTDSNPASILPQR